VRFWAAAAAIALLALAPRAEAQGRGNVRLPITFGVGERLEYEIRYGPFTSGAEMEIANLDTIRGRPAWHAEFSVHGGVPFFRVNDNYESWIDVETISTLRYKQDIHDGSYERHRVYEFLPARRMVVVGKSDTTETVDRPLDEASILYFLRTIPLPIGLDTAINNYFMPDRNPIRIEVLGREHISVPAGEFDAIIIHPEIKAKGVFSEDGHTRVWLSDDDRHIILQMKTSVPHMPVGSLNLYLKSYRPPTKP
jgi:hypothetical protein